MNQLLNIVRGGSAIHQSLFLMVCGILFVFATQLVFYFFIKLWPRKKDAGEEPEN